MKKLILCFLCIMIIVFIGCQEDDYEVDYKDAKIKISYENESIAFYNNLDVPVIIDNMRINDQIVTNYIKYKSCDYIKFKDEVIIRIKEKYNQVILINSIVLPHRSKVIPYKLKKEDYVLFEFYPVTYIFLSDNVYFLKEETKEENKYRLYPDQEIKDLKMDALNISTNINELSGIMIYVKEYELLEDTFEEKEFELE